MREANERDDDDESDATTKNLHEPYATDAKHPGTQQTNRDDQSERGG